MNSPGSFVSHLKEWLYAGTTAACMVATCIIASPTQAQSNAIPAGDRVLMGAFVDRDWTAAHPCGDKITQDWEWADNKQWYGNASPYFGKIFPEVFRPDGSKNWYYLWEAEVDKIKAQGRVPYINLEFHGELALHDNSKCWWKWDTTNQRVDRNIIKEILDGKHNDIIDNIAHGLKAEKVPVVIDLFHEANGAWYDWSPCKNRETWARFRDAFKHVVDRFRAVGATNVQFGNSIWPNSDCWTDAGPHGTGAIVADMYVPGYMDWIGIDIYGGGDASFKSILDPWYGQLVATGRPIVIGEMAVTPGAHKAQWIRDFADAFTSGQYPKLRAFNWFDIDKQGEANWRIDADGAGPVFDAAMKHPKMTGSFGTYELKNKASGKCLDVPAASTANGAKLQVYTCNGTNAQTFTLADLTGYKMELRALNSGKCVDVAAAGTADGTLVQQYDCNASGAQTWTMKVITWAPLEVEFVAAHSGKCLDVDMGIGPKVHQWWCTGGAAQRFVLTKR